VQRVAACFDSKFMLPQNDNGTVAQEQNQKFKLRVHCVKEYLQVVSSFVGVHVE
jgi:hypothetical protein